MDTQGFPPEMIERMEKMQEIIDKEYKDLTITLPDTTEEAIFALVAALSGGSNTDRGRAFGLAHLLRTLNTLRKERDKKPEGNATFTAFKTGGKYYTSSRGFLPEDTFSVFTAEEREAKILEANKGCFPGLNGPGKHFVRFVSADDNVDFGYPLMFKAESEDA